jgi:putative membrane protein
VTTERLRIRKAAYIGGLFGLSLLITLFVRADFAAMVRTLGSGGWMLLCLIPYRILFFFLYAACWFALLRPYDPGRRAGLGYLLWATTVREAIDRLLPVASIGGGVVGVRLLRWRGIATGAAGASVVTEIVLTVIVLYVFTAMGLFLLADINAVGQDYRRLLMAFLFTLPVPAVTVLLLRYGSVFGRLQKFLRPFADASGSSEGLVSLDRELHAYFARGWTLLIAGILQFAALISASFEIWFALRMFGHPVGAKTALILESMTQAVRHLAFVVPGGLGVQEAGLVLFGQALGVNSELALSVSMVKRMREVLCGLPALFSWQWFEGQRLRRQIRSASQ